MINKTGTYFLIGCYFWWMWPQCGLLNIQRQYWPKQYMVSRNLLYLWLVVFCNDISYNSIFWLKVKEYQWKTNTGHGKCHLWCRSWCKYFWKWLCCRGRTISIRNRMVNIAWKQFGCCCFLLILLFFWCFILMLILKSVS